ncbi:MAG: hypothetical protein AB1726_04430 [Planctomycetota bacterium]
MPFPALTALARHVASSDPYDREEQRQHLDCLHELRDFVRRRGAGELAACLDAAAGLIEVLASPADRVGRAEIQVVACRLLRAAEEVLGSGEPADAVTPALPPEEALAPTPRSDDAGTPAGPLGGGAGGEVAAGLPAPAGEESAFPAAELPKNSDMVLGRMLVWLGHVTRRQVAEALRMHRAKGLRVGECLLLLGAISPGRLLETLKLQARLRAEAEGAAPAAPAAPVAPALPAPPASSAPSAAPAPPPRRPPDFRVTKDMFLGEVLLGADMITNEELERAMHIHHHEGLRVGEALVKIGALTPAELESGLELQRQLRHIAGLSAK